MEYWVLVTNKYWGRVRCGGLDGNFTVFLSFIFPLENLMCVRELR
jgi:hypothetical protein